METKLSYREARDNLVLDILQYVRAIEKGDRPPRLVPLLVGTHGIGKTQMQWDLAHSVMVDLFQGRLITNRISEMPEGEIAGFPDIDKSRGQMVYRLPSWWRLDWENEWTLVFFDEINRGQRLDASQQLLHKLLHERQVHEHPLPEKWVLVAACNPEDTGDYQVSDLLSDWSLRTRFKIYPMELTLDELLEWGKGPSGNNGRRRIHPVVSQFFARNPNHFNKDQNAGRMIEEFSQALYFLEEEGRLDLFLSKCSSMLDFSTAIELNQYYRDRMKELPVEEILKYDKRTREKVRQFREAGDNHVLLKAVDGLLYADNDEVIKAIPKILEFTHDLPPEIAYRYFFTVFEKARQEDGYYDVWFKLFTAAGDDETVKEILGNEAIAKEVQGEEQEQEKGEKEGEEQEKEKGGEEKTRKGGGGNVRRKDKK